jgi:hypothetical protein
VFPFRHTGKITCRKENGYVLKIAARNTHGKLNNGQHADIAKKAGLACFNLYKRLTGC